jgi:tetratricopeptide (TPR) repeat protein
VTGIIVTFYSWKGGVGRTMALANTAVQLARRGRRVLAVDWDLEAPGLERYFGVGGAAATPRIKVRPAAEKSGLLGLLTDAAARGDASVSLRSWQRRCAAITVPPLPADLRRDAPNLKPAPLHLLPSGHGSPGYAHCLHAFSWPAFFTGQNGAEFLESLRDQWRDHYDLVLIDSRTGLTDSGGVCTVQLPDMLVLVFTANSQSIDDGLAFVTAAQGARAEFAFERAPMSVIPLLARWEGDREVDLAEQWLDRLAPVVAGLADSWLPRAIPPRRLLERLRVPHVARFSFGEPLPVLTHSLTDPDRPGLAYDLLAELLGNSLADAGSIIDPSYAPPFDPALATQRQIDDLALNDAARREVLASLAAQPSRRVALGDLLLDIAQSAARLGRLRIAGDLVREAVNVRQALVEERPNDPNRLRDLGQALDARGDGLVSLGDLGSAALSYRAALAIAERLAADSANAQWQRDLSISYDKLGNIHRAQGDLPAALASHRAALAITKRLAAADPANAELQRDLSISHEKLGGIQGAQGDLPAALASYRAALTIAERLAAADPGNAEWQRDLSVSHNKLGDIQGAQDDLPAALASYRAALAIAERLAAADPGNAEWQRDLSISHNRLGDIQVAQGDFPGALASYRADLSIAERLAAADPANAEWQRDLSISHEKLGNIEHAQGDLPAALASYRAALAIRERLAAADPGNAQWQRDLSVAHNKLGDIQGFQGDLPAALASYRAAVDIAERLAAADPVNAEWQRDLAVSCARLAAAEPDPAQARALLLRGHAIIRRLAAQSPTDATLRKDLVVFESELARRAT